MAGVGTTRSLQALPPKPFRGPVTHLPHGSRWHRDTRDTSAWGCPWHRAVVVALLPQHEWHQHKGEKEREKNHE